MFLSRAGLIESARRITEISVQEVSGVSWKAVGKPTVRQPRESGCFRETDAGRTPNEWPRHKPRSLARKRCSPTDHRNAREARPRNRLRPRCRPRPRYRRRTDQIACRLQPCRNPRGEPTETCLWTLRFEPVQPAGVVTISASSTDELDQASADIVEIAAGVGVELYQMSGVLGSPGGLNRFASILDPKGEFDVLAKHLGAHVVVFAARWECADQSVRSGAGAWGCAGFGDASHADGHSVSGGGDGTTVGSD